jgi:hypothetical protein
MDMADVGMIQLMLTAVLGLSVGACSQWVADNR